MRPVWGLTVVVVVVVAFSALGVGAEPEGLERVFGRGALTEAELGEERGGQELSAPASLLEVHANLDHNTVSGTTSGTNVLGQGAFSGSSGFATVIQNTGHNVTIQHATIVNVTVE